MNVVELPLQWVAPSLATAEDYYWLGVANSVADPVQQTTAEDIHQALAIGNMHLFRFKEPSKGVLLVQLYGNDRLRRLAIYMMAGKGIARSKLLCRVRDQLLATAAEWNCSAVECLVVDPRLARAIMRAGARQESVTLVLEVPNGR